ncbi:hypothetical protein J2X01_003594 [Arthrobacter ginsengisoli]|uniref:SAM-dependent methyltransferase n=1 Tax=Arthrobacter ginsengisoli TaxID=1356565 RepID=A0ABU1UGF9_9MICC|nr:hypothetical protein [Arthrobacter ginsengisoli]
MSERSTWSPAPKPSFTTSSKFEEPTLESLTTWNGNQRRYEDWVLAYNDGLALAPRWFAVNHMRIVCA